MATKLNPLKSWWALALGGTPGESEEHTETAVTPQQKKSDFAVNVVQLSAEVEVQREEVRWSDSVYLWVF